MLIVGPDPNWQADINARWARTLSTFLQMSQERKAREEREYELHMQMLASDPALATGEFGDRLTKRWGSKHPELVGLVSTLRNRQQLEAESDSALGAYHQSFAKMVGQRNSDTMKLREMPDTVQPVLPWSGGASLQLPPMPNQEKMQLASQIAMNADPGWDALAALPEDRRTLAIAAMHRHKIAMPKAPDTIGVSDLSDDLQGLVAAGYAVDTPEFNQAALTQANLRVGITQETQIAEAKRHQAEAERIQIENDKRDLANQLTGQENQARLQSGLIRERAASRPVKSGKASPEEKAADKQLTAELKDAIQPKGAAKGYKERKEAALSAGEPFTEPEPKKLTLYELNQLADIAKEAVKSGAPMEFTEDLKKQYAELLASGMSPSAALKDLRQGLELARSGE
jgi:hypothetical protein